MRKTDAERDRKYQEELDAIRKERDTHIRRGEEAKQKLLAKIQKNVDKIKSGASSNASNIAHPEAG
jgi:hypothetical protein